MKPLQITFKAKPIKVWVSDNAFESRLYFPEITPKHCDMNAFRQSRAFGPYANSDLFPGMLRRLPLPKFILASNPPQGIAVSEGFLCTVTFAVTDSLPSQIVAQ